MAALRGQVEMLHRELELAQTAAGTAHAISREHLQVRQWRALGSVGM